MRVTVSMVRPDRRASCRWRAPRTSSSPTCANRRRQGMPSFVAAPEADSGCLRVHPLDPSGRAGCRKRSADQGDPGSQNESELSRRRVFRPGLPGLPTTQHATARNAIPLAIDDTIGTSRPDESRDRLRRVAVCKFSAPPAIPASSDREVSGPASRSRSTSKDIPNTKITKFNCPSTLLLDGGRVTMVHDNLMTAHSARRACDRVEAAARRAGR